MAYKGRTHFRSTRFFIGLMVGLSVFLFALSIVTYYKAEPSWVTLACWAFFAFSLLGIADAVSQFVSLEDDKLCLRRNLLLREVARADIESVSAEKGCPIQLILKDGSKVEIPPVSTSGVANSIRAWIKATPST